MRENYIIQEIERQVVTDLERILVLSPHAPPEVVMEGYNIFMNRNVPWLNQTEDAGNSKKSWDDVYFETLKKVNGVSVDG